MTSKVFDFNNAELNQFSKIDKSHFYTSFYYRLYQQYGTQNKRYDDLFDCNVSLLKAQAQQAHEELGANT